jgi:type IV pilus assembly protein PilW
MKQHGGFSLTELMIAMLLGLLLLGLILTTFSSLSASSSQSRQLAFLQQNGQLAINLLYNELQNTGFFGGQSLTAMQQAVSTLAPPAADCFADGMDSGSFPRPDHAYLSIFAGQAAPGRILNCLSNLAPQTEYIQVKRAIGAAATPETMRHNRFYLLPDWQQSRFVDHTNVPATVDTLYPYQHLVLYIQLQRQAGEEVPVLMRKRLIRNSTGQASISTDSMLDGVERLHFEFLIDSDLDGIPDYLLSTTEMSAAHWLQQESQILGLRFYVLVRTLTPDRRYRNEQLYHMGKLSFQAPGDHYRRLLLSGAITFDLSAGPAA